MIPRIIITALLLTSLITAAVAQNSIDGLIDNYSSVGMSKFTSAVERDPRTHKVLKVVKVLQLEQIGIKDFIKAFKGEAKTGDFSEKYDDDGCTLMLTTQNAKQNRIYMLRCSEPYIPGRRNTNYGYAKITLIIKYK